MMVDPITHAIMILRRDAHEWRGMAQALRRDRDRIDDAKKIEAMAKECDEAADGLENKKKVKI